MLLYVIRHGDPIYSPDSLTPKGRRQAEAVAKRLAVHGLDQIFCSPLGRAQETAKPTAELLGLDIQTEPWTSENLVWHEFTYMDSNGRKRWLFSMPNYKFKTEQNRFRNGDWRECDCLQNLFDAEHCYDRLIPESDAFLSKLGYEREGSIYKILRPSNERIALFCHEGFTMCWFPHLLGIPPHLFWSNFSLSHSGVNIIEFENYESGFTAPRCLCWSDLSHIYAERLPLQHKNKIEI